MLTPHTFIEGKYKEKHCHCFSISSASASASRRQCHKECECCWFVPSCCTAISVPVWASCDRPPLTEVCPSCPDMARQGFYRTTPAEVWYHKNADWPGVRHFVGSREDRPAHAEREAVKVDRGGSYPAPCSSRQRNCCWQIESIAERRRPQVLAVQVEVGPKIADRLCPLSE